MTSALCQGVVSHQRYSPVVHGFSYSDSMFYFDLEALEKAEDGVLSRCRRRILRRDHFGDGETLLSESVRQIVHKRIGVQLNGSIGFLTHIRQLGYVMNPVSFYYCWSADESSLEAIVAEVHNTPWGESHCYVMRCESGEALTFRMPKVFHVSPFMGMDQEYVWTFTQPEESLTVFMENWEDGLKKFDATLKLHSVELTENVLRRHLWTAPFTSIAVIVRIYLQALRLWVKRCPTFTHPKKLRRKDVMK